MLLIYQWHFCAFAGIECVCEADWIVDWCCWRVLPHQHCFNTASVNVLIGSVSVLMFLSGNKPLNRWCHRLRPRRTLIFYSLDQRTLVLFHMEMERYSDPALASHLRTLQAKPLCLFHALVKILGCFSAMKFLSYNWTENLQNTHIFITLYLFASVDFDFNASVKSFFSTSA